MVRPICRCGVFDNNSLRLSVGEVCIRYHAVLVQLLAQATAQLHDGESSLAIERRGVGHADDLVQARLYSLPVEWPRVLIDRDEDPIKRYRGLERHDSIQPAPNTFAGGSTGGAGG